MSGTVIFDPLLPEILVYASLGLMTFIVLVALWRGLPGWWLRALAVAVVGLALMNPSYQQENRTPLNDIVLLVVDESASQRIANRGAQTRAAVARVEAEVAGMPNTELRKITLRDAPGNEGTLAMGALAELMAEEPRARIAGAILISDGRVHDIEHLPALPAPLHLIQTGLESDWDRRLTVKNAPGFAIINEEIMLTLRIDDDGAVPGGLPELAELSIAVDGAEPATYSVPIGEDLTLPVTLGHGGMNVIQFSLPTEDGELTGRNNIAVTQINGVRDRLRVLLVSGEPHAGERTWRNLLKSDSSVDLVHFTILRPPDKQDGVPVTELSLIAFPVRELFLEKIDEFDLIIFDRYRKRGILPTLYLDNIRSYVMRGGAVLIAAGPYFASAESIYRSPLGDIIPAAPTARVLEEGFLPKLSELGERHPVTRGLTDLSPKQAEGNGPGWGRWFRLIDLTKRSGNVVMTATDEERPLLVLDRVGEGRVALMASDHAWLWSRGFEGGGPQLELLRRLAHWMMKEPDLEEEALTAMANGQTLTVTRRTLAEEPGDVSITSPDGQVSVLPLIEEAPGQFMAEFEGPELGLYRLANGDQEAVIALGPSAPREFEQTIATPEVLAAAVEIGRGGVRRVEDGLPGLRRVRAGRTAAGRGWIGITPRGAFRTADVTVTPLGYAWLYLLLAALFTVGAWLLEGRQRRAA